MTYFTLKTGNRQARLQGKWSDKVHTDLTIPVKCLFPCAANDHSWHTDIWLTHFWVMIGSGRGCVLEQIQVQAWRRSASVAVDAKHMANGRSRMNLPGEGQCHFLKDVASLKISRTFLFKVAQAQHPCTGRVCFLQDYHVLLIESIFFRFIEK